MISRIIKVEVKVISLSLRLVILTETLIILDITKTECNNCLLYIERKKMEARELDMIARDLECP